jgi:molybdopterin converting factor subunit 1
VIVHVKLFAIVRERAGVSSLPIELPEGASVETARDALHRRFPSLGEHLPRCAFAVNHTYVKPDTRLSDGDELALIPPVSGG